MSSKRGEGEYLADIQEAARYIREYIEGYTFERFVSDRKTQDAVIRNLEIIGEAAKHVSPGTKSRFPDIPWKSIAGHRNRLIHGYFGVNFEIVWEIITEGLPVLEATIQKVMNE
jgi:uncharacterized protein with HEPN domain